MHSLSHSLTLYYLTINNKKLDIWENVYIRCDRELRWKLENYITLLL